MTKHPYLRIVTIYFTVFYLSNDIRWFFLSSGQEKIKLIKYDSLYLIETFLKYFEMFTKI